MSNQKTENEEKPADVSPAAAEKAPAEAAATPPKTPAEEEEAALVQLQGDLERFRDLALRSQADFDNFRKRAAREKEEAVRYANSGFLERLIPLIDNFELGLNAARSGNDAASILAGMDMVAKQLVDFLADSGVQPIDAIGQKFDPHIHEAIGQEVSAEVPEGKVVRQLRKGYKLKDRLLRPANVIVSKGKPSDDPY